MKKKIYILFAVTAFSLLGFLWSCSSQDRSKSLSHSPPPPPATEENIQPVFPDNQSHNRRKTIIQYALRNIGTPYRWGGTSPKTGFDCSGLIFYTHQKAGLKNLPRTTKDLFNHGKPIPKNKLNPADIVFFKNPDTEKKFHAGIYIGHGLFVHAPGKGRPVSYANLSNPYFKKHYIGSRSFL